MRETSKRIIALCEDKQKLKAERTTAREQKKKILGVNERLNANEDNYLNSFSNSNKGSFKLPDNRVQYSSERKDFNNMGSYDNYQSQTSLTTKIGSIMEGVDKMQSTIEKQEK